MARWFWLPLALLVLGCGGKQATREGADPAAGGVPAMRDVPDVPATGGWQSVSVGRNHACALAKDGSARCWGATERLAAGPFASMVVAWDGVCGVLDSGEVQCLIGQNEGRPITGDFVALTATEAGRPCGLTRDGAAVCADRASSAGPYAALEVGSHSVCGIRPDGSIVCWADDAPESPTFKAADGFPGDVEHTLPYGDYPGKFSQVAVGYRQLCARSADGAVQCWGELATQAPEGRFVDIQASENACCGLRDDGTVGCWGSANYGILESPPGVFTSLSVGRGRACAVRADHTLACWGAGKDLSSALSQPETGRLDLPLSLLGDFDSVQVGEMFDCGLDADGAVSCWFGGDPAKLQVPDGTWSAIAAGDRQSCGLRDDGTAVCWGQGKEAEAGAEGEKFSSVAAGSGVSCALHADDGALVCWGSDCGPLCALNGRHYLAIDAGEDVCGITADQQIECAEEASGATSPLAGNYSAVVTGWGFRGSGLVSVCGLDPAGALTCSGGSLFPGQGYQDASVALGAVVAVDQGGDLVAHDTLGSPFNDLPRGPFVDVDLGTANFDQAGPENWGCAVTTDGQIDCFGGLSKGWVVPPATP